jgi:hypothetical protein
MSENIIHTHKEVITPHVNMKIERNSRGVNYSVTVEGAETVDEALKIITDGEAKLKAQFGSSLG